MMEAMPVKRTKCRYTGEYENHCPGCGAFIERFNSRIPWKELRFCGYCGQEVIWSKHDK